MYRILPVQNKFLEKKWNKFQHDNRIKRIRETQSCLDDRAKGSLHKKWLLEGGDSSGKTGVLAPHQQRNFKKEAIMEARFTEIEKENRRLLEKMSGIMKNGDVYNKNRPPPV